MKYISYALLVLMAASLGEDWEASYYIPYGKKDFARLTPLLNPTFLTSFISMLAIGFMSWLSSKEKYIAQSKVPADILKLINVILPVSFLLLLFLAFYKEIGFYFDQLFEESILKITSDTGERNRDIRNWDLYSFKSIWLNNYSILVAILFSIVVFKTSKNELIKKISIVINLLVMVSFISIGLYEISELRESYVDQVNAEYYSRGMYHIWIRYVSIGLFAILTFFTYKSIIKLDIESRYYRLIETAIAVIVLWVLSSELIHWIDIGGAKDDYGLGLSILWGVFCVIVIAFGIWKKKKHLRMLGIVVFTITLIKLFFYDLSNLNTISKTIVLVSLGILLLGTSFLYNKYTVEDEN